MRVEEDLFKNIFKVIERKNVGLHEPKFDKKDILEVSKCIRSSFVSTYGKYVVKFENLLKEFIKSKYVIATNTGTSALHTALICVGVKKNTNVLVPTLSFVATANSIIYCGAEPIFLDSSKKTMCLDEIKLRDFFKKNTYVHKGQIYSKHNKKKISAIIATHVFGSSCQIDEIVNIGKKYSVPVIEDCAEGIGSFYKGKHLGTFGDIGIFSFNGNKIITSGSGGAISTNSKKKYLEALHLVSVSKVKHKWEFVHDRLGWNYRMNSLSASLGFSQLKKLNYYLNKKKKLHRKYKAQFKNNKNFKIFDLEKIKNLKSNFWLNAIKIETKKTTKKRILEYLNKKKIYSRPIWNLLHTLPYFKKYNKYDLTNSKKLFDEIVFVPSSANLIKK